jgi:hypothetical protein
MKNHKIAITLSHDDFSKLEELREHKYCRRNKSGEIAWLISQEWERLKEQNREKTSAADSLEKKAAGHVKRADTRIIQFPFPALQSGMA